MLMKTPLARSLDWNLLRVFHVIVEERSISKAANTLNRTQPAVSTALKRLEEQLGTQLVVRNATTFRLTDNGRLLHRECSEVFNTIGHIPSLIAETTESLAGTLSLTMASHMVSNLIDEALALFHERHPNVSVDITLLTSASVIEQVLNRSINFGVCLAVRPVPGVDYLQLYREHFGFFCGPRHRFFGRRDLTLADLQGESAVTLRLFAASEVIQAITAMYRHANMAMPFAGISDNLEEIRRMIIAGLGIGAMPIHVMQRDVRDGLLWQLPPYQRPTPIDVYLVSNQKAQLGRIESAFMGLVQEIVKAKPIEERTYPRQPSSP
ncbi:LysR family transcriptional regulator [Azospirillum rugosum]|uniref:DNA-binding transcriptional LysR family regulator n=1 Tax=Azospirillum rugosum TaxID=416170 RepID=A0ABS4SW50_9PROT|nr:LysR family transcriptional regulator [Azospirillum rugosum]MBP2296786.1 DNA-binding transcriptional LysR family regulator [Azospirillum rugosum]MDQ0530389.1 DNA-binding transcriptional LysR family regulator [Azospirillum rugosum]